MVIILAAGVVVLGEFADWRQMESSLSLVAFIVSAAVGIASVLYLLRRDDRLDWLAIAAARAGLLATSLALAASAARHRSTSTLWWSWEVGGAMLLLLWLGYVGYFLLRNSTEGADRAARFAAVFATLTAVDAPFLVIGIRSFVAKLPRPADAARLGYQLDGAALMLFSGLFLSFLLGMFYLYGSERSRRERVSAPVSIHVSTE